MAGTVFDQGDNSTLPGASVVLVNAADTTQRKTTVTDMDGVFRFAAVAAGTYSLRVEFVGYDRQARTV
ncbi:MAG TPA: carboxypeptidase regulatory-like domain-containing protein, partial [Flavobacteriales bacterium]|nr:carboxypeptidase regulatory-like domain-containing protein [Flavobacteriales bacterium]